MTAVISFVDVPERKQVMRVHQVLKSLRVMLNREDGLIHFFLDFLGFLIASNLSSRATLFCAALISSLVAILDSSLEVLEDFYCVHGILIFDELCILFASLSLVIF